MISLGTTRMGGTMLAGAFVVACLAAQAHADFVLTVTDLTDLTGPGQIIVIDNQGIGAVSDSGLVSTTGDVNGDLGAVAYSGSIGSAFISFNAGVSKPLGRPGTLDLLTLQISGASTQLLIQLTDNDYFLPASGQGSLVSSISGSTDGTVEYHQFYDTQNREFAGTDPLNDSSVTVLGGAFGAGSFSETIAAPIQIVTPYSLTEAVLVTHDGAGTTTFNIISEVIPEPFVPEPASMALLGLGGLLVGSRVRRK